MIEIKLKCTGTKMVALQELIPLQGGLKRLSKESFDKLKSSLVEKGFLFPFFVWEHQGKNYYIDGHQRDSVLKELAKHSGTYRLPPKYPVVFIEAANAKEAAEAILLQSSVYGKIESEALHRFIQDFSLEIDWEVFSSKLDFESEFGNMQNFNEIWFEKEKNDNTDLTNADALPEGIEARCRLGDLWQLGPHRLLCGDATDVERIEQLLNGQKPLLMVTDPPYGVNYDPAWRKTAGLPGMMGAVRSTGKVTNDDIADWSAVFALFSPQVLYVWHASLFGGLVQKSLEDCGYRVIAQIIWAKPHFAISRGDYHWQHEPCWYAAKRSSSHHWQGSRSESTLWEIPGLNAFGASQDEADQNTNHSTQKPVLCMEKPILNNSAEGDLVVDPFLGSGSTLIAAERSSRICYGMEINPRYCDIILQRWEDFTGKKAMLLTDNERSL